MAPIVPNSSSRDRILDAAERLLPSRGFGQTTLDHVAHEAGLARRALDRHFTSKEDVFLCSIDRVVERLLGELQHIADERSPADVRLWRMLVARVMLRFDSVRRYHESLDELLAGMRTQYLERRGQYFERETEVLARVVDDGRRVLGWSADDPRSVARALVIATNALLPYSLSRAELGSRAEVQARVTAVVSLLLRGLAAAPVERTGARQRIRR